MRSNHINHLSERYHSAGVVELAAVVGRREESDELALGEEFVAVLDHLRGELQIMRELTSTGVQAELASDERDYEHE